MCQLTKSQPEVHRGCTVGLRARLERSAFLYRRILGLTFFVELRLLLDHFIFAPINIHHSIDQHREEASKRKGQNS